MLICQLLGIPLEFGPCTLSFFLKQKISRELSFVIILTEFKKKKKKNDFRFYTQGPNCDVI